MFKRNIMLEILLLDDDEEQFHIFSEACKKLEMPVNVGYLHNPRLLIETLRAHSYDILFLDLNMPALSGEDCLRELKRHGFNHMTVVVLSGGENPREREASLALGAKFYFQKPYTIKDLTEIVKSVIQSLRQRGNGG